MAGQVGNRPANSAKLWTEKGLNILADNYGRVSDKKLAGRLQRSETSIEAMACKNGLTRRENFYNASELARVVGVSGPNHIIRWKNFGYLKGKHCLLTGRKHRMWMFLEENIEKCLRQRPWLVDPENMERHFFRSIVKEEWQRDPWYTLTQAMPLLGLKNPGTTLKYISRHWLAAEKGTSGGGKQWIIRRSAIKAFLANGHRASDHREYINAARRASARKRHLNAGRPVRIAQEWLLTCPACGQPVKITTDPQLKSPHVRQLFIRTFNTNEHCNHNAVENLSTSLKL